MDLQTFAIKLVIVVAGIWLTQFLVSDVFTLQEKPKKLVVVVVALIGVIWLVFGPLPVKIG